MGFRDSFLIVAIVFTLGLIPAWIMGRTASKPGSGLALLVR